MKICVLSGSPKGKNSVTYQTVRYLEKKFPKDRFTAVHVGQTVRALEKDLSPALKAIEDAELLLFCYPVYTFVAPYQLHRFVELLKASGADLSGKRAAQLCTSKHFFDVTAMNFIRENCADLGLPFLGSLSADMDDLLTEQGQKDAVAFWKLIHWRMEHGIAEAVYLQKPAPMEPYRPVETPELAKEKDGGQVVVVADLREDDDGLRAMIEDFSAKYRGEVRLVNLREFPFAGGCIGCFNCAADGKCIHKDGFDQFLRNEIQTADAIVYAFTIADHSMGSRMKLYDDRQFCNGHRTVTSGMPMGYLIHGDLTAEPNLRTIIEGRANVGGNYLCGTATDGKGVADLAETLRYAVKTHLTQPANFLGVGGMKIFRDLIWVMQGMMKADHKYYKEHGIYDFPQKKRGTILKMKLVGKLISSPKIKAKMGNKMTEGMLAPYEKLLKKK